MRARIVIPGLLLLIAAAPAHLTIGSETFAQADILDARGLPELDGSAILITLSPEAAPRLTAVARANVGKPIPISVDGMPISAPVVREEMTDGALQITGLKLALPEAEALALRISGKPPLPDSLDE